MLSLSKKGYHIFLLVFFVWEQLVMGATPSFEPFEPPVVPKRKI